MGSLDGRIAIITGAGNGIGREHALLMAVEGAKVVVNDLGASVSGEGRDAAQAQQVVDEIRAAGGTATANGDDVADWAGAQRLVQTAIDTFGGLDILVNNAGILRDRTIASMSEAEWDAVIQVHLRGHFAPLHFAAAYWKKEAAADRARKASVINTTSTSGLKGSFGQSNYGAAKAGIAALTTIGAMELAKSGVRVNAVAPAGRTRMTDVAMGGLSRFQAAEGEFDVYAPANISPLVAYLATENAPETGRVYFARGGYIGVFQPWHVVATLEKDQRWTVAELSERMMELDVAMLPAY